MYHFRSAASRNGLPRRDLLKLGLVAAPVSLAAQQSSARPPAAEVPWYRRAYRWGQTNITEKDPVRYDIGWWRQHWKATRTQAVIINAGGIVAYYPSKFPLHHRAAFLGSRDLFGELTEAAHQDGLFVVARMDSNRAGEDFFRAHPDWFARDAKGEPIRAADKYVACIHSGYYDQYLPDVLTEIASRYHPEGFSDNSWAGLGRDTICYCANCGRAFRDKTGQQLPARHDFDDPVYRRWILFSYARRIAVWELNNRVTRAAGGPHCIWSGMNSGSVTAQARSFRDLREICRRAEILFLDHQRRDDDTGFQQNGDTGKRIHALMGWDKLAPESMALYQSGPGYFRVASKPAAEAQMWMIAGLAAGIQPWWHHISAYHEDRRQYRTAEPVMRWCADNQRYLVNRTPVASVGLVWSQRNTDFFGRNDASDLVDAPYTGFMHALVRARIPYLPVHADDIETQARDLSLLILPNVGALSDSQCAAIRAFAARGGSVFATGATSLYDEWGDPRADYALASLFGVHTNAPAPGLTAAAGQRASQRRRSADRFSPESHTYLRLIPELRSRVPGPKTGDEPAVNGARHAVLAGFEETDLIPYGGLLSPLRLEPGVTVPLTYVPPFPTYPPETAWMREPVTSIPGLVLRTQGDSRNAYLAADIDRRYFQQHLPDHGNLLANVVRWSLNGAMPMVVEGPGLVDCHLYRQENRLILHLVNLTNTATWRSPMEEFLPVGPFRVRVRLQAGVTARSARLLVAGNRVPVARVQDQAEFRISSILSHEAVLIE